MNPQPIRNERMERLERTVLELGTEIYRLKNDISTARSSHDQFLDIMKGLKLMLDEKGIITSEDFESAVDLGNALASHSHAYDHSVMDQIERIKKIAH